MLGTCMKNNFYYRMKTIVDLNILLHGQMNRSRVIKKAVDLFLQKNLNGCYKMSNQKEVQLYQEDSLSDFVYTNQAYHDILEYIKYVSDEDHLKHIPDYLPVYLLSGGFDNLTKNGKDTIKLYQILKGGISMELNIDTNCITYLKSLQSLPLQQAVSLWDNLKEINYAKLKSMKPSIYIDIDGTLAYFYRNGRGFTYEEMFFPGNHYFRNLEPHIYMIYLVETLSKFRDVCIISSADYKTIQDKYEWIKEYLPFISDDNIFFCPLGVDKTKFVKGNAEKSILIDDYNLNLEAWDKNGGVAIKAINSINTPTERFVHINVRDKEKWLKSQMESSGDEQIEKLKTKIIEMQIKNWIKADTEFIKQVLNINERCD